MRECHMYIHEKFTNMKLTKSIRSSQLRPADIDEDGNLKQEFHKYSLRIMM